MSNCTMLFWHKQFLVKQLPSFPLIGDIISRPIFKKKIHTMLNTEKQTKLRNFISVSEIIDLY